MSTALYTLLSSLVGALLLLPGRAAVDVASFDKLKHEIHLLPQSQVKQRLEALRANTPTPPHQNKIDHFVVLLMENHAYDNMFGCMDLPGADGVRDGHSIPIDPSDPSKGVVNVTCGTPPYVCTGGPGYNLFAPKFQKGANSHTYPYDKQSDAYSYAVGGSGHAISMFAPEQIPVKATIAKEFGIFNKMYTSVPSASQPNHLFIQSGTSCGVVDNIAYNQCGGRTETFPQMTIYDSLYVNNVSFSLFLNSTCGIDGNPQCAGGESGTPTIHLPDVIMSGVGRYKNRFFSQEIFYEQAANGSLPAFSWLMPPVQGCDHPCQDIAKGERLLKDIYEALRAGPKWEKTLFYIVYDDAGAYYDHVVPPFEDVPSDDAPCHVLDQCSPTRNKFDFRRLGLRTSAMLISPWVAAGSVIQSPKGPYNTSQFDHTSVIATARNLFNLTGSLTKRDMWAGSFDELLLDQVRTDAPLHLPTAPKAATPWTPPPNMSDTEEGTADGTTTPADVIADYDGPEPQHCSLQEQECRGPNHVNAKQRRQLDLLAALTGSPKPDAADMTSAEAAEWVSTNWGVWMSMESDPPMNFDAAPAEETVAEA
eukprot:m.651968 g.651968  ORF g.651968 m.651968 type:complete len:591 (-) comp22686_c0_seq1:2013-3785(-)